MLYWTMLSGQSFIQSLVVDTAYGAPIFEQASDTVYRNTNITSLVSGLSLPSSPTAIVRFIVSIVVFAFKHITFRTWAKAFKKCRETVFPFRANCNTAGTVIFPFMMFWIEATRFHCLPAFILPSRFACGGLSMATYFDRDQVWALTAATGGFAGAKGGACDGAVLATNASTIPITIPYVRDDSPSTDLLTLNVNNLSIHAAILLPDIKNSIGVMG